MPTRDPPWPPGTPCWIDYGAADVDAAAARVTDAGGSVVMAPMDVGPMGRMAIARDPQGHPFGLWQSGQHTGVRIYNEPGSLVWNEAAVDDLEAAQAFYGSVFGFHFDPVEGLPGYTTFSTDGRPRRGIGYEPGAPKGWATCFSVSSTDEAVAAVEQGGGKVIRAAEDTTFGRFAVVEDPWGAAFPVMQEPPG